MHLSLLLAAGLLGLVHATPIQHVFQTGVGEILPPGPATRPKKLNGKFLHITDFHPDPFYKVHSSTEEGIACHRAHGPAGSYGAETSDCDSPFSLVNATFRWIAENVRDEVDFVVWTGDSARHDSDEEAPRSAQQVLTLNNYVTSKFIETFGDENHDLTIPIVPTFGNNDILPHNILLGGPNKWLKTYTSVWQKFIPEEQRHGFERGGWFYVEVIPKKLAVFSLNTLYFFDHNSAVDGCNEKSEPGFEHMEWLRIQLQFIRERGMKAMIMGHVPPARTDSKQLWDETCWQKYTLWLQQFRDVVVGGFFGHMNIDHFMLQDTKQIDLASLAGLDVGGYDTREHLDDELTIMGAADYLEELRENWSKLPDPSVIMSLDVGDDDVDELGKSRANKGKKKKKSKKDRALKKMGGPYGERYQLSTVSPSIVPNFFPTLRIVEYNVTGLDLSKTWADIQSETFNPTLSHQADRRMSAFDEEIDRLGEILTNFDGDLNTNDADEELEVERKKKHKGKKGKKGKKPNLNIPAPPAKTAPPGPAYSPQTLTLLGYTQYFANLTHINNDFTPPDNEQDDVDTDGWKEGKHKKKSPKNKIPKPKKFKFEVEYNTLNDSKGFKLKDMTVRSYLKLAHRIGQYKPNTILEDWEDWDEDEENDALERAEMIDVIRNTPAEHTAPRESVWSRYLGDTFGRLVLELKKYGIVVSDWTVSASEEEVEAEGKKKKHRKKKHDKGKKSKNQAWYTFVRRAFVGVMDEDEVKSFDVMRANGIVEDDGYDYNEL